MSWHQACDIKFTLPIRATLALTLNGTVQVWLLSLQFLVHQFCNGGGGGGGGGGGNDGGGGGNELCVFQAKLKGLLIY